MARSSPSTAATPETSDGFPQCSIGAALALGDVTRRQDKTTRQHAARPRDIPRPELRAQGHAWEVKHGGTPSKASDLPNDSRACPCHPAACRRQIHYQHAVEVTLLLEDLVDGDCQGGKVTPENGGDA